MSVNTSPGPGCGHELRPGTQTCTVCGTPAADDGRRTAGAAEEQVPAPSWHQEVTTIREPVTPTSRATITDRPSEREGRRFCGRCGHALKPAVRFCGICGHSVPDGVGQDAARIQDAATGSAEDLRAEPPQAPDSPAYAQTITATPARPVPPPPTATSEGRRRAVLPGGAPARRSRRPAVGWPLVVALAVLVAAGGTARRAVPDPAPRPSPGSALRRARPALSTGSRQCLPRPKPRRRPPPRHPPSR